MSAAQPEKEKINWDQYSLALILIYAFLQVLRWRMLPQFMDIYYHILTAWGFIQAGGYVGWDFWQYAPMGRVHIYPPFFHIILAFLMKCGADAVILAKFFETVTPLLFLIVLWSFVRRNFSRQMAFLAIVAFSSSFSFYLALLNHIPASWAGILGMLALDQFLRKRLVSSVILLTLSFYTHIGIPWCFGLAILFYGLWDRESRILALLLFFSTLALSAPMLFKELSGLTHISALGFNLQEKNACQFKIAEYLLAAYGLFLSIKKGGRYRIFFAFFLASLIFLLYPYRFFSAEGYLAVLLFSSLALSELFDFFTARIRCQKCLVLFIFVLFGIFSPTLSMNKTGSGEGVTWRIKSFDSAFLGMLFAKGDSIWLDREYSQAAQIIKKNSDTWDIVYSRLNPAGMALSAVSARPTAGALFTEIGPSRDFDRFASSKIIIFASDEERGFLEAVTLKYSLEKIGETEAFILYRNPGCRVKAAPLKASVPFAVIALFALGALLVLLKNRHKIYLT